MRCSRSWCRSSAPNEFLLALSFNSNPMLRTLVGITLYQGEFAFPWPVISAALVVGIVPVAVLIVIFQERIRPDLRRHQG